MEELHLVNHPWQYKQVMRRAVIQAMCSPTSRHPLPLNHFPKSSTWQLRVFSTHPSKTVNKVLPDRSPGLQGGCPHVLCHWQANSANRTWAHSQGKWGFPAKAGFISRDIRPFSRQTSLTGTCWAYHSWPNLVVMTTDLIMFRFPRFWGARRKASRDWSEQCFGMGS